MTQAASDEHRSYAVVIPAYNEAKYIHFALDSVLAQTCRPRQVVVVDDGSSDETFSIVERYVQQVPWVQALQRNRVPGQAYFASNVYAIMEGVRRLDQHDVEFLAILDADISLPSDYYETLLARFQEDPMLGVASGVYDNLIEGTRHAVLHDRYSTPKAIMVFRRTCFADVGGFLPLPLGGEDTCACVMARMKGWKAWSFPDIRVLHHRPTGTGNARSVLRARFRQGLADAGVRSHPLFVLVKMLRRCVLERPYLIGGLLRLAGYSYGCLRGMGADMPADVVESFRREQLSRLLRGNRIPRADVPRGSS